MPIHGGAGCIPGGRGVSQHGSAASTGRGCSDVEEQGVSTGGLGVVWTSQHGEGNLMELLGSVLCNILN